MEEEKKQKIEKARKRMELLNKFRFADTRQKLYNFLWYDIVLLFVTTFAKLFAAVRYNSAVRKI